MTHPLAPYVPRLVLQWGERSPEATYQRLEGSLAFCDLSGFTAMSEKLASLGRLGAEELTDVLNLLFAALLDDAASFGGGLLKYGGDAVLLFFEGDDHAKRAAAATHRMRATLRRVGRVKTSKGAVRVRMSVGIHTGEFDFFLVGETHRELIVTGIGATTTCDMETAADAGEILISPSTAASLPASCVGDAKGDGFLLSRAPRTAARDATAWGVVPDIDPLPFIPVGLHRHIGAVGADAEHRHVAVGFIAFGGVDELLTEHGGEHTADVLHTFIASCQAAFDRFEVCFLYADIYGNGGKVFFTVGAPISHEDNEERLLRAALEINATHYPGLHLHTGLNRGYVFAGDVGAKFRRTYTIIGDAVNTAARVMASCPVDGQIRSMPEVVDLAASRFETEAQTPFAAKGKAEPLTTVAVGQPLGPRRPDAPLPLIGRDEELATLRAALDAARAGHGQLTHVVGDAGIGKSRLVEELRAEAEANGIATLTTFAERYERETPYFAIRQLLQALFGDEAPTPESLAVDVDADATPRVMGRALVRIVNEQVEGPALWVMENGHLLDDGSVKVIEAIVSDIEEHPWLLVDVRRSEGGTRADGFDASTIAVGPLETAASVDLVTAAHPGLLPTQARLLAERSNGNPFLIRQLAASAADGTNLSDSIEAAVAARVDRLSPENRDVLRTAAVLGGRFEIDDLHDLLDGRRCDFAALADFVAVAEGVGVFRQATYRDVAYSGLTFRRRRGLHLAAARRLSARSEIPAARLSFHYHEAQSWPDSWRYSMAAAEDARRTAAKVVTAELFGRAADAGRRIPRDVSPAEVAGAIGRQAEALLLSGDITHAESALSRGRRIAAAGTVERSKLHLLQAIVSDGAGDVRAAGRWFRRGLDNLEHSEFDLQEPTVADVAVSLLIGLARTQLQLSKVAEAQALADRARALAATGPPELQSRAHTLDMFIAFALGDVAGAIASAELSVEADRLDGRFSGSRAVSLSNLGSLKLMVGEWRDSEALQREAIEQNVLVGNDSQAAVSQLNLAEVLIDQGVWDEAGDLLRRATPVVEGSNEEAAAYIKLYEARLAARTGRLDAFVAPEIPSQYGLDGAVIGVRIEAALRAAPERVAALLGDATPDLDVPLRAVFAALSSNDPTRELSAVATGDDPFSAVVARSLLGRDIGDDEDAKRLGIVAVPDWARPAAT